MISITRLLGGTGYYGDSLRYHTGVRNQTNGAIAGRGPVVVWNCTRSCNLQCIHCYASAEARKYEGELTNLEALRFIDQLAEGKVPVLLLSGGEPLLRKDLGKLIAYASSKGIRVTLSTNGTLLNRETVLGLKHLGVGYIGVSIDGIGAVNDRFRGRQGAYNAALSGIRTCTSLGQRVGLRFTINKYNYQEINAIFDLLEEENIPRVCFYHLVYSGRGSKMVEEDISKEQTRAALDLIIQRTQDFRRRCINKEILTVDNHADGVYVYLRLKETNPAQAEQALELLRLNGGNRTGMAFGAVDWQGNVHPDQFTQNHTFGNVREKKFGDIWADKSQPVLAGLKNRKPLLKGRCAVCQWLDICNGNFRARAEAVTGDFWESDPACYLTNEEIGIK
ncbi:MAG: putative heme d1 biosynthesis radical SAM protein NirJ1 [Desulfotomaculaceae bacterium]|nr:putative heme d1 biosynthesis radical SAM protein NirJ1 [Desulfotomaculaceae bacterium]